MQVALTILYQGIFNVFYQKTSVGFFSLPVAQTCVGWMFALLILLLLLTMGISKKTMMISWNKMCL